MSYIQKVKTKKKKKEETLCNQSVDGDVIGLSALRGSSAKDERERSLMSASVVSTSSLRHHLLLYRGLRSDTELRNSERNLIDSF